MSDMQDASYWIKKLDLQPHPEGGFYRQTYRADLILPRAVLPDRFAGDRSVCTGIYFLLHEDAFSAFHRIQADEMWHFYAGSSLLVSVLKEDGSLREIKLGPDAESGEVFQALVPYGRWFASCLVKPVGFSLVGCTVSPGFDFEDFEMADRAALIDTYPQHRSLIEKLTRT